MATHFTGYTAKDWCVGPRSETEELPNLRVAAPLSPAGLIPAGQHETVINRLEEAKNEEAERNVRSEHRRGQT